MGKVRAQAMSRGEADEAMGEQMRLKRELHGVEQDIRSADESIRHVEKAIVNTDQEIKSMAEQVNENLAAIKLQRSQKVTEVEDNKYHQGIHIVMSTDTGLLNHGKIDLYRDVVPLVEDLKSKWKAKISSLQQESDKLSHELVEHDLLLRNIEEDKKRVQVILDSSPSDLQERPAKIRSDYERVSALVDQVNREIDTINR